jgi:glycosyltransferase involved in cell wall biosynthesis
MKPLSVIFVVYHYDKELSTPDELLAKYSTIHPVTKSLRELGANVTVFQRFHTDASFERDGVAYRFLSDSCPPPLGKWQIPGKFHHAIENSCDSRMPTVVHLHGLFYPVQLAMLKKMLSEACVVTVQHHAEHPWRKPFGMIQRRGLRVADGFFFAAKELAAEWIERGIISSRQPIFPIMEGSTKFTVESRPDCRALTGISGSPVLLWVGRLIKLKDPLTVLRGFDLILEGLPEARLYMAYHQPELLGDVQAQIAGSPRLKKAVVLLGQVPHAELERIYNSADYFVLGSHYEGSGFALAEAMACGVVPVVTDIPSFRTMTGQFSVGGGWTPGNASSFAEKFLQVSQQRLDEMSNRTINFFQDHLSYSAIARDSLAAFQELLGSRLGAEP